MEQSAWSLLSGDAKVAGAISFFATGRLSGVTLDQQPDRSEKRKRFRR
jgi:hypothetical protein